jgi:hypothetical protein
VHDGVTLSTIAVRSSHPTEVEMCLLLIASRNEHRVIGAKTTSIGSECDHAAKSEISDRGRGGATLQNWSPDSTRILSLRVNASHRGNALSAGQVFGVPSSACAISE